MIYCICRGSIRGRDLCHSSALTSAACTPASMKDRLSFGLLSKTQCAPVTAALQKLFTSPEIPLLLWGAFDMCWVCLYGSWPWLFRGVEVYVFLVHFWWAHLLDVTLNFINFVHSQPWPWPWPWPFTRLYLHPTHGPGSALPLPRLASACLQGLVCPGTCQHLKAK